MDQKNSTAGPEELTDEDLAEVKGGGGIAGSQLQTDTTTLKDKAGNLLDPRGA